MAGEPVVEGRPGDPEGCGRLGSTDLVDGEETGQKRAGVGLHESYVNEPELKVKPKSSLASTPLNVRLRKAVAIQPDTDDRGEAVNWFVQMTILHALDEGRFTRQELLEKLGIGKGHLSQIEHAKLGMKFGLFLRFCDAFGENPGDFLNRALAWWPEHGRKWRAKHADRVARRARRGVSESGEHASVPPQKAAH